MIFVLMGCEFLIRCSIMKAIFQNVRLVFTVGMALGLSGYSLVHAQARRTAADAAGFRNLTSQIGKRALAPFKADGRFNGQVASGAFDASNPAYMLMGYSMDLKTPNRGDQRFTITLIRFEDAVAASQSAEFQVRHLKAPSATVTRPPLTRLGGEGNLGVGSLSYYLGTADALRPGAAHVIYKHEAFAWEGQWLVKVLAQTTRQQWSVSIKALEKELLENLLASASGERVVPWGGAAAPVVKRVKRRPEIKIAAEDLWGGLLKELKARGVDQGEVSKLEVKSGEIARGQHVRRLSVGRKLGVKDGISLPFDMTMSAYSDTNLAEKALAMITSQIKATLTKESSVKFQPLEGTGDLRLGDGGYYLACDMEAKPGLQTGKFYHYYTVVRSGRWVFTMNSTSNKVNLGNNVKWVVENVVGRLVEGTGGVVPKIEVKPQVGIIAENVWANVFKKLTAQWVDQGSFMAPKVWTGEGYRRLKVWRKLAVQGRQAQEFSIGIYQFNNVGLAQKQAKKLLSNITTEEKNGKDLFFRKLPCHGSLLVGNGGFLKAYEMQMGGISPKKTYQYSSVVTSGRWVFTIDSVGNQLDMSKGAGERIQAVMTQLVDAAGK